MLAFAPGARVVIRDEEWLVRRVDPSTEGGGLFRACSKAISSTATTRRAGGGKLTVVDECRNVVVRAGKSSHLSRQARQERLLTTRSYILVLRSATPHHDSACYFGSLMGPHGSDGHLRSGSLHARELPQQRPGQRRPTLQGRPLNGGVSFRRPFRLSEPGRRLPHGGGRFVSLSVDWTQGPVSVP